MTNLRMFLMSFILIAVATGCNSVSESLLVKTLSNVKSGDLKHFKQKLEGKALVEFGNETGLSRLQSAVAPWDSITSKEVIVKEAMINGRHNIFYRDEIFGQTGDSAQVKIGETMVRCITGRMWFCSITEINVE